VIPLRNWLANADRPGRRMAGDWTDGDVARLRDGLKRGCSLAELAAALTRSPDEIASRHVEAVEPPEPDAVVDPPRKRAR